SDWGIAKSAILDWPSWNLPRLPDLGDLVGTQAAGKAIQRTANGAVWLGRSRRAPHPGTHLPVRLADRANLDGTAVSERKGVYPLATGSCAPDGISGRG